MGYKDNKNFDGSSSIDRQGHQHYLKKHQNAPRPSEHPPVIISCRGETRAVVYLSLYNIKIEAKSHEKPGYNNSVCVGVCFLPIHSGHTSNSLDVVVVVVFTLTDRASTIPSKYVVANPVRGHKEVPRSTGHIMVTTRYSDQQGSKSRQKIMRLYKRWHRPIAKRFIKLPLLLHIESSLDRLGLLSPTHDQRSQQQIGQTRSNQF